MNVSDIAPLPPHTLPTQGSWATGLWDPQAGSAGGGAGLFTIAAVYGAGGHGLKGRGLNAQSPSSLDSRRLPNGVGGGGVRGAVGHGSEPKLTRRLEDPRNPVGGAAGVGDGRRGRWVLASQATPTAALQAQVKVGVPGEGRV